MIRLWDAWGYSPGWCTSFLTRLHTELSHTRNCGWILTVPRPSCNSWPAWIVGTIWRASVRPSSSESCWMIVRGGAKQVASGICDPSWDHSHCISHYMPCQDVAPVLCLRGAAFDRGLLAGGAYHSVREHDPMRVPIGATGSCVG